MKYLGIDWGKSKIGLAIADEKVKIASPIMTLSFNKPGEEIDKIKEVIKNEGVKILIVGQPTSLSGKPTSDQDFNKFVELLNLIENVEVKLEDERLTTKYAKSIHKQFSGYKKVSDDEIAATAILQGYLDRLEQ